MRRLLGWYGAGPLHLLSLVACLALAGYAALRLVPNHPLGVLVWFVGAAVGHDALLFPLYAVADRSLHGVLRHRAGPVAPVTWLNHLRVPAALSGLLLLVWFPLIARVPSAYEEATGLTTSPYLARWLLVTGGLFAASALVLAVRSRRAAARG